MSKRSTAFFINGGAGRVLCSIPALEQYHEENKDDDFIVVCEGGSELFKGHPVLDSRSYDVMHKNIFQDKIKERDIVNPEPYRIWEYYNQKASLTEAFDISINNKGLRLLPTPTLKLSRDEIITGANIIKEVKDKLNKKKVVVFQPFGRGIQNAGGSLIDPSGRSFEFKNAISLMKKFQQEDWAVILFSEIHFDATPNGLEEFAKPEGANLRIWAAIIKEAELFVGCDSVGQHISRITQTPTIAVLGSTYPINVSYPETDTFKVIDLGKTERKYSPIRITIDEAIDRNNEMIMSIKEDIEDLIITTAKKIIKNTTEEHQGTPHVHGPSCTQNRTPLIPPAIVAPPFAKKVKNN